jgi:predicted glycosyltransferase
MLNMAASLSHALQGCSILILTDLSNLGRHKIPEGVDYIHLPAAILEDSVARVTKGREYGSADARKTRYRIAQGTIKTFRPDLVLFDDNILEHSQVREIEKLASYIVNEVPRAKIIWGLSDTLGGPEYVKTQWANNGALRLFDRYADEILIFGAREIFDLGEAYEVPERIARKFVYTGYLTRRTPPPLRSGDEGGRTRRKLPTILLALGGGPESFTVIDSYLRALERGKGGLPVRSFIVASPGLAPHQLRELTWRAQRLGNVVFRRHDAKLLLNARHADLVICDGRYEIMCEILPYHKMAMVMANANERLENSFRARLFQAHGLVTIVPGNHDPSAMRKLILKMLFSKTLAMKFSLLEHLMLNGLSKTVERVQYITGRDRTDESMISALAA